MVPFLFVGAVSFRLCSRASASHIAIIKGYIFTFEQLFMEIFLHCKFLMHIFGG